jgi:TIGR03009 family protein
MLNYLRGFAILSIVVAAGSLAHAQAPVAPVAPAAPAVPDGFQLNAMQQAYLDQVLSSWETQSGKVTIFECPFERWEFNATFGPGPDIPLNKNKGNLSYQKPDKGSFEVSEINVWDANAKNWLKKDDAIGEHWVCDGQNVYEYRTPQKQLVVRPIPPAMQGKAIVDGPLPFLFGAEAAKLKARYFLLAQQDTNPNQIMIVARPKWPADAAEYRQVDLMLDRAQMIPVGMRIYLPNKDVHLYIFDLPNAKVNETLQRVMALFSAPRTPWGWKRVVEAAEPPVAPMDGRQAAQPDGVAPR